MTAMSKLSKNLLDRQEMQRQKTINIVLRAVADLKAEGYSIKIKDLLDYTGLSRSVFSKPHIRSILEVSGIAKGKNDTLSNLKKPTNRSTQICNLKNKVLQKEEYILKYLGKEGILYDKRRRSLMNKNEKKTKLGDLVGIRSRESKER